MSIAQVDAASASQSRVVTDRKTVIFASTLGTIFEWYDFYLYGTLAAILGKNFFASASPLSSYIFGLLIFAVGFVVRPFGALVFGRLGDAVGRKHAFLATILIMGLATFSVGLLPTYATIGIAAPIILIALRMLQGLAVGGEYGGAAVYIAEHAEPGRRGAATSWLQTAFLFGLVLSLIVVLGTQSVMSTETFQDWGWRVPFLLALPLLGISVWIRLKLHESPIFAEMKAKKKLAQSPVKEAFLKWKNLRTIIVVLMGFVAGQGAISVAGALFPVLFLANTLKVDPITTNTLSMIALVLGVPFFIIFGHLSDRVGRKPFILLGLALGAIIIFPVYKGFTHFANPALALAQSTTPVVVLADPATCSFQFNPVGTSKFTSPCDVAKTALIRRGIPYSNESASPGAQSLIRVGNETLMSYDAAGATSAADAEAFQKRLGELLLKAGYPAKADPERINFPAIVGLILCLQVAMALVFGPMGAALVEIFPAQIRYTSLSVPYHIGNGWFGGLLPTIVVAIQAATGSIYSGLWYPVIVAAVGFAVCFLFIPETKDRDLAA